MTDIVNLTEHDLVIFIDNGKTVTIPPCGIIARCNEIIEPIDDIVINAENNDDESITGTNKLCTVPLMRKGFGSAVLPLPVKNTVYFVSQIVAAAFPERNDLVFTGEIVRDDAGQIIGVKSLAKMLY